MPKKNLNQNAKYVQKFVDSVEPDFFFSKKPLNRFDFIKNNNNHDKLNKIENLKKLEKKNKFN